MDGLNSIALGNRKNNSADFPLFTLNAHPFLLGKDGKQIEVQHLFLNSKS
jgi:hypothetical protein